MQRSFYSFLEIFRGPHHKYAVLVRYSENHWGIVCHWSNMAYSSLMVHFICFMALKWHYPRVMQHARLSNETLELVSFILMIIDLVELNTSMFFYDRRLLAYFFQWLQESRCFEQLSSIWGEPTCLQQQSPQPWYLNKILALSEMFILKGVRNSWFIHFYNEQ